MLKFEVPHVCGRARGTAHAAPPQPCIAQAGPRQQHGEAIFHVSTGGKKKEKKKQKKQ